MDPSLEDPSSLTTGKPQSHPTRRRRRRENRCERNDLNKFRPKKTSTFKPPELKTVIRLPLTACFRGEHNM
jgi:hypothetical protein